MRHESPDFPSPQAAAEPVEEAPGRWPNAARAMRAVREELANLHPRVVLARLALAALPDDVGTRTRARVLRLAGFNVGHGTVLSGTPHFTGPRGLQRNLAIGSRCYINVGCRFDLNGRIAIGNEVAIGHDVLFVTATHVTGPASRRGGPLVAKPISVGDGAWLGARCVLLPGVTVGSGAVVAAGAVVASDVPPNTVAGGVPARVISELPI
ncbi:MAG: acyltransferase [Dehalococcoidia bacterium]